MIVASTSLSAPPNRASSPPAFQGLARVEDYAFRVRMGFTARLALPELAAAAPHPFAGSPTGFAFGRRLLCRLADAAGTILFSGDAILLWWGDDSRRGKRIELVLDGDHGEAHPLSSCAAGRRDGDVLEAIIEDALDGNNIPTASRIQRKRLFALAHELPKNRDFRDWFLTHVDGDAGPSAEDVAAALKAYCGLGSRRELLLDGPHAEQARGRLRALCADFRAETAIYCDD